VEKGGPFSGICYNQQMQRKIDFTPGEFYHIYNRGTDKRDIFTTSNDFNRFMVLLYLCNSLKPVNIELELKKGRSFSELWEIKRENPIVDICAYCLMPNHFHFLIKEVVDGGITKFMGKLSTAYSMYFNKKYNRTGALFEGRFKAKHIDSDNYLKYLLSYIHLNPVKLIEPEWKESGISDKVAAKNYLKKYHYSSYMDFLRNDRIEKNILTSGSLPRYFETFNEFEDLVDEWLMFSEEKLA